MTSEERDFKRRQAKDYFLYSPFLQNEIAERVGVSVQTITAWKEDGGWAELKRKLLNTADKKIDSYCKLIDIFSALLEEQSPDIDKLVKTNSLIEKMQVRGASASDIEKVGMAIVKYLDERMPDKRDFFLGFYRGFAEWYDSK